MCPFLGIVVVHEGQDYVLCTDCFLSQRGWVNGGTHNLRSPTAAPSTAMNDGPNLTRIKNFVLRRLGALMWLVAAILGIIWGIHNYLTEREKIGYITQPLVWSGSCPASITCGKDGKPMKLEHCFQHKGLHRQVCRFEHTAGRETHYLYVACD